MSVVDMYGNLPFFMKIGISRKSFHEMVNTKLMFEVLGVPESMIAITEINDVEYCRSVITKGASTRLEFDTDVVCYIAVTNGYLVLFVYNNPKDINDTAAFEKFLVGVVYGANN